MRGKRLKWHAAWLNTRLRRRHNRQLSRIIFRIVCLTSLAASVLSLIVSSYNYPGGLGLIALDQHLRTARLSSRPTVHLDSYSCMTGASNMLHRPQLAIFDKDENIAPEDAKKYGQRYNWLLSHEPELHNGRFEVVDSIEGWAGLQLQIKQWKGLLSGKRRFMKRRKAESIAEWLLRLAPIRPRIQKQVYILRKKLV